MLFSMPWECSTSIQPYATRAKTPPSPPRQDVRPFRADAGVELLARARHDRKGVASRPGPASIDDHAAVSVGAGVTLRGDEPGLLGVTAILLLDGDREPEPAAAGSMRPHALDLGHAGGLDLVPHGAGAVSAAIERVVIGRDARNGAEQDRIVAVHERLDPDRRLLLRAAGVVSGPFAQRSLLDQVVRVHEPLEGDLRLRRNG